MKNLQKQNLHKRKGGWWFQNLVVIYLLVHCDVIKSCLEKLWKCSDSMSKPLIFIKVSRKPNGSLHVWTCLFFKIKWHVWRPNSKISLWPARGNWSTYKQGLASTIPGFAMLSVLGYSGNCGLPHVKVLYKIWYHGLTVIQPIRNQGKLVFTNKIL